jgi:hypothetical protein
MFGISYIKFEANTYVLHYSKGKIKKEGRALSFFYFAPSSSIVAIPMGSSDIQFIFNEITKDFQQITIQGQITYAISDPKQLAELLDFTVDKKGNLRNNDIEKLRQRLINEARTTTSAFIKSLDLKSAIVSLKEVEQIIREGMEKSDVVKMLGINILGIDVLEVSPSADMQRFLETQTREALQQEADLAIYQRRNFAVEQERKIKESELNTEITIEGKKKQIAEKKMQTEVLKEENKRKIREMQIEADIAIETQQKELVEIQSANQEKVADTKEHVLRATLAPYKELDWKKIMAIQNDGTARTDIAIAFRELAEQADKIGTLNITPDLLSNLVD